MFLKKEKKMVDIKNYNSENIFAKILRNEIPSEKVFENDDVYAFNDINPQAKIHILIIPKSSYCSFIDFSENASPTEQANFYKSIQEIVTKLSINNGYRLITNVGLDGGQEVPHFHFHLLSGRKN
jgi:diadenosine tetraphosphate (Ap4A) HIT family hydrolase